MIVYHRHQPDIKRSNARFLCIDIMKFGEDGKILPVVMTNDWQYQDGVTIFADEERKR